MQWNLGHLLEVNICKRKKKKVIDCGCKGTQNVWHDFFLGGAVKRLRDSLSPDGDPNQNQNTVCVDFCFLFKLWNHLHAHIFPVCLWQVGCMPWLWGSTSANSSVVIDSDSDSNHTMTAQPCDGARYTFLSCVVGTLTLALFLRVSWLPKMALMLLLGVLYVTVLELSGFRKSTGWGLVARCDHRHKPHAAVQLVCNPTRLPQHVLKDHWWLNVWMFRRHSLIKFKCFDLCQYMKHETQKV